MLHHTSHDSMSVLRTIFKVYGKKQTLTLSQPKTPEPIVTKFEWRDNIVDTYHKKFGLNPPKGFCTPYRWNIHPFCSKFTTLFWFFNSPTGESVRPIFTINRLHWNVFVHGFLNFLSSSSSFYFRHVMFSGLLYNRVLQYRLNVFVFPRCRRRLQVDVVVRRLRIARSRWIGAVPVRRARRYTSHRTSFAVFRRIQRLHRHRTCAFWSRPRPVLSIFTANTVSISLQAICNTWSLTKRRMLKKSHA